MVDLFHDSAELGVVLAGADGFVFLGLGVGLGLFSRIGEIESWFDIELVRWLI